MAIFFGIIQKFNKQINERLFVTGQYVKRYRELIAENCSSIKTIVHLGSGRGNFRIFNDSVDFQGTLISLDIDKNSLRLDSNPTKTAADAGCLPFPDNSIDLIVTEHTFEHLEEPEQVLKECHRSLHKGGKLIFATPNKWSYISIIAKFTPLKFHVLFGKLMGNEYAEADYCPTFYRLNSLRDIKTKASMAGFTVEELNTYVAEPCYTTFLPGIHLFFVLYHKILEKIKVFQNLRISIVGVLIK